MRIWLMLAVASVAGAQAPTPLVVRPTATPCLNVRPRPSSDATAIACLAPGSMVQGDSAVPFWRRIRTADGVTGWAAKKFLEPATGSQVTPNPAIPDSTWLEVHIVDVGQGDGIWIATWDDGVPGNGRFDGRNIVIDGGPDGTDARNEFLRYVSARAHAGATIDALLVTHPHNDHYPGARGILRHFDVCHYYDPGIGNAADFDDFLGDVARATCDGAPITMHRGRAALGVPDWGAELKAEFLWAGPVDDPAMGSGGTRINNNSLVLKLTYGTQSFLFMGDAEGKDRNGPVGTARYVEGALLADSATRGRLPSTVLKVAHHGSETSSTVPFIAAVNPSVVVVSSGRRAYGGTYLPDASTLRRYCAQNAAIRIYRTDKDDAAEERTAATDADGDHIVIRTNGRETRVEAYTAGQRYTPTSCTP